MRRVKKGMTLLEVVISLAIIAIMIVPLMNSLLTAVRANKKGEEVQDAKLLGQQIVEKLRLQEDIEAGNIEINAATVTLGSFNVATGSEPGYFDVTSTEVDGFTIEGKVVEDDVVNINDNDSGKEYLNKKLGALLVVTKDKIEYYSRTGGDKSIKEIYSDSASLFLDRPSTATKDVELEFIDNGVVGSKVYSIKLDGNNIATDTTGGLAIYVKEKSDFKFNIKNTSAITQDIVIFRDSSLSKDDGMLKGQITQTGILNMYTNILFDVDKSKTGLYTAKLDIKKDNKTVEKIESQFYLGE